MLGEFKLFIRWTGENKRVFGLNNFPIWCHIFYLFICAQTQDLQIFKKFNMSSPKEVFHNTVHTQFNYFT